MLHLPHASELSLLWPVNMKHCDAVSSRLHSIEDSCVSNRIMNSGAEVCWTCQCRCVCVLESASYFAVWVIRYIVRLGEETAPALRPIRVQDEPKQGLGFLHSYVSLSMCVCVTDPLPADHTSHILPHGEDLPASRPRTGICLPSMPVLTRHLMIWYG